MILKSLLKNYKNAHCMGKSTLPVLQDLLSTAGLSFK
jgi:hypothetical protein